MEGEEWMRQTVKIFDFGEDRDVLYECPRPLGVLVLGCLSPFFFVIFILVVRAIFR
jgi:hypothetical protein